MPVNDVETKSRDSTEQDTVKLNKLRNWFRSAFDHEKEWKDEAYTCFRFLWGEQWDESAVKKLDSQDRPHLTINKILPLINLVSGHQKLNVTEPDFRPRGGEDQEYADLCKGITKYILDREDYQKKKARVFKHGIVSGRAYFYPHVKMNYDTLEPEIKIDFVSPFDVYVDPESRDPLLDDANFVANARWVDKDDIIAQFPEYEDEINGMIRRWDEIEEGQERATTRDELYDPVVDYDKTTKKVRLVNIWYREKGKETRYLHEGKLKKKKDLPFSDNQELVDMLEKRRIPKDQVKVASFCGHIMLEDLDSPYKHGYIPIVPYNAFFDGEGESPFGIVKNLLDPQREINKRRSQFLHMINKMANRGWFHRVGSLDANNKRKLQDMGSTPGVSIEYSGEKPEPWATDSIPSTIFELDKLYSDDIKFISGINEAMMAVDLPASTSGRAIELRQKQAVVQIADLFDNLKDTEKRVVRILWGERGRPGLIPQYFTEEKTMRITTSNGEQKTVTVNQRVQDRPNIPLTPFGNPFAQTVERVLNDLSVADFDVIITDSPATPSQRAAEYYALLELRKAGVEIPPHIIVDSYDFSHKEELKQWYQMQMQAAQQQMQPANQSEVPPGQPGGPAQRNPGGRGNTNG